MPLDFDNGFPSPQIYEDDGTTPQRRRGSNGAAYGIIFGPDGITPVSSSNRLPVDAQLSGSNLELFVADEGDVPAAATVEIGATVMIVNTGAVWQSNGTDWVVLA